MLHAPIFTAIRPQRLRPVAVLLACLVAGVAGSTPGLSPAADAARFDLETSDGVTLATWYYPRPEDGQPLATVILVHDFDGSHKELEPLALALQTAGCTVAVPDLRGHGASTVQAGRDAKLQFRQMKKADLEVMATGAGGRLRAQSAVRGDIETVYGFLLARGDIDDSGKHPLAIVGCGAGATLAALWTAADWGWPPIASGPQGQQVRALVMVSPVWAAKGLGIQPALATEALKQDVPTMLLAGKSDRDTTRLFDQLRKQRPDGWFQRIGSETTRAADRRKEDAKKSDSEPPAETLFLFQLDTTLSGEELLDDATTDLIVNFLSAKLRDASR